MITAYILVLGFSAWLLATLLLYVTKRFGKLFGNPLLISTGFVLLVPLLGFMVVVAAPAGVLVGCVLLAGSHLTRAGGYLPTIARFGVPVVAALLAGMHLVMPTIPQAPPIALHLIAMFVLFGCAVSADRLPSRLAPASFSLLAAALPLVAAPLFGAPSYLALDVLILASVLMGANMASAGNASVAIARQPFGLILGWLAIAAAVHGAWIPAVLTLLIYGGSIAMELARPSTQLEAYAP
jgi:hypothetical protein